ncbi:MAG: hypothetical protein KF764_12115 [Labilithrix sp.]|nr:hypothetical protein [Labilithrix sp.]
MMTGVAPRRLNEQLGDGVNRSIVNIALHEQSPIAFFDYLAQADQYPDVIITNVSSWLNGTNYEQEGALVAQADPLRVLDGRSGDRSKPLNAGELSPREGLESGRFQREAETAVSGWAGARLLTLGRRYHLFDYSLFVGTLATSANLDTALYQLNMQSWFRVLRSETDGQGFVGIHVEYRDDWPSGLERMAQRSLQRMRLSRLLDDRYWSLLEDRVKKFQARGSRIVFVRMPEHPMIRAFNDETYRITEQLHGIEERTGAALLDISHLGLSDGVHLFDAVHPDAAAAEVVTREIALRLRALGLTVPGAGVDPRGGR